MPFLSFNIINFIDLLYKNLKFVIIFIKTLIKTIKMRSASLSLQPNKKVGNYTFNIQSVLGSGSYSTVYLGQHEETKQQVAIKVVTRQSLTDSYMFETLESEIVILKHLDHPNIVRLYDVLNTANNVYIITEYCKDGTLDELLKREKHLPEAQAINVMRDLLYGFREILKHNIVHRDIKPANIFIHEGRFKIGDFGFAKKVEDLDQQLMKSIVGTPLYMSPECLQNRNYSSKNDVYSLGIIFFKLLYGRTPWPSRTRLELLENMSSSPLIIPQEEAISIEARQFLMKALQYREHERINWQEIYDHSMFQSKNGSITVKADAKAIPNEELIIESPNKNNELEVKIQDRMITSHIGIIRRIDGLIKGLAESPEITISTKTRLSLSLMKQCQFHTSDLKSRVQAMKALKRGSELMEQVEEGVLELEEKNNEDLKGLKRILQGEAPLEMEEDVRPLGIFEEIKELMRPVIRECNHKIRSKGNGRLLRVLGELIVMFQVALKCGSGVRNEDDFSMMVMRIEEDGHEFFNEEMKLDYPSLRRVIYEQEI